MHQNYDSSNNSLLETDKEEEKFIRAFRGIYKKAVESELENKIFEKKRKDHYFVTEELRGGTFFACIVPEKRFEEYKKVSENNPDALLGFSILVDGKKGEQIRVGCYGISSSKLLRSLANTTKRSWSYRFMKKRIKSQKKGYGI